MHGRHDIPATVSSQKDTSLPSGRPPWDAWNGLRIGALAGGILGILIAVVMGATNFWIVIPAALGGGAIGYWSERRKRRRNR